MTFTEPTVKTLSGIVKKVVYHNHQNGYHVLSVKPSKTQPQIMVVGNSIDIQEGMDIEASGSWINDKKYGHQFKAHLLTKKLPYSSTGVEKYLASGVIEGIGPKIAKKIATAISGNIFEEIERNPDCLKGIRGISSSKAQEISQFLVDQKTLHTTMVWLHGHHISAGQATKIYKEYGLKTIETISTNPYTLADDIKGIGFLRADEIAENLGIEKTSMIRAQAGIFHTLNEAKKVGHCGLPRTDLLLKCATLLKIEKELAEEALEKELAKYNVVKGKIKGQEGVFLKQLARAEQTIASRISQLQANPLPWNEINLTRIDDLGIGKNETISLSESQKRALVEILRSKVAILTGGPGVGKTTIINAILQILKQKNLTIALAAPTGRAAKRLTQATGMPATTIHRMLQIAQDGFVNNEKSCLSYDLVIIDEVSMVDVLLMSDLLKKISDHCALFLVGDADQLPSVGPGQVLNDLIQSKTISVIHLTEIFRQAKLSQIITASHDINKGILPDLTAKLNSDFCFIETTDSENTLSTILHLVKEKLPQEFGVDPLVDVQVLSPMKNGPVGTIYLNIELQKLLNPVYQTDVALDILSYGVSYKVGDKVMQTINNYDKKIYNGDIGFIKFINKESSHLTVAFDNHDVVYHSRDLDELTLAYATTIHKAQGSEFPVVIIPVVMSHYIMLQKNLIYTAITRGKKLVILVGHKKALQIAVNNHKQTKRYSTLQQLLNKKATLQQLPLSSITANQNLAC